MRCQGYATVGRTRFSRRAWGVTGIELEPTADPPARRPLLETYERLLATLEVIALEAERGGDDGIREWAALAGIDAVDVAEELGMLHDDDAERRRRVIRARVADLDRSI